jgi:hypothetical protein
MKRHRFKQDRALGERLIEEARRARERAEQMPPGREKETLQDKTRQADVTARIDECLNSPGLRAPT